MKIALLTDGIFPYVIGGMQKHSYCLAKYLARQGVEIDLYHFNQSERDIGTLELFSEQEKQFIHSVVIPFPVQGKLPGHYLRESYEYSRRVYEAMQKRDPVDYIYAKGFTAWSLLDQKRKGTRFPPVGVNFHGYEMFQPPASFRMRMEQYLLRSPVLFNLKHADQVFSYGGKITGLLASLGIPQEKIIELPAGIESEWLIDQSAPTRKIRRFIFAGRYERRKGIEELHKMLLGWEGPEFEFVIAGPIPLSKQIKKAGIKYTGGIADQEVMKTLLRGSDILVCPSHSEGMPNIILEGLASGLAIIATDVGAVPAMVDNENGWLISPGSEKELEAAFRSAVHIPEQELDDKKRSSLIRVKELFFWDKLIHKTIDKITERLIVDK